MSLHVVQPTGDLPPAPTALVFGVNAGGGEFAIDYGTLLETRLLIQASSGGGKTYFLRQLLAAVAGRLQRIVLDIENEFKDDMDRISVDEAFENGVWDEYVNDILKTGRDVVLDFSGMSKSTAAVYVGQFCERLMSLPPPWIIKRLVVIDEAHLFAPDKVLKLESAKPVIDLACRGRKRGICAVFATQRLSKLHKDVAAECLNKLIGRTQLDIDVKRAAIDMEMSATRAQAILPKLTPGLFYAMGPAIHPDSHTKIVSIKGPEAMPQIPSLEIVEEADTVSEGAEGSKPNWLINFECMEQAAENLRTVTPDGPLEMASVLEGAGIDTQEWYAALGKMKVNDLPRCVAFYTVVGRKMRGIDGATASRSFPSPGTPSALRHWSASEMRWKSGPAPGAPSPPPPKPAPRAPDPPPPDDEDEPPMDDAPQDQEQETGTIETIEAPAIDGQNVGAVTQHVTTWLEDLDDEKRVRVIKAVCMLLNINLDPPAQRKKPGPKPGFRKALPQKRGRAKNSR